MPVAIRLEDPEAGRLAVAGFLGWLSRQPEEFGGPPRRGSATMPCPANRLARQGLAEQLKALGRECAALPDLDHRSAEEIIGYDGFGVPR